MRSQLKIQTVNPTTAAHIVFVPGIVEADPSRTVNIMPPSAGHLIDLPIKLGDVVKVNQLMATIQSSALAQAYSDRTKALSIQKQSEEALNRAQKVNRAGANAIKDIEIAQSNYTQALAEVWRTQENIKSLGGGEASQLHILAPLEGKVITLNYGIGSYINDITTPIFTVSNIRSVLIAACVPEHLIAFVKKGQKVRISLVAYPHKLWNGNIAFINNILDSDTRCNKTRIVLSNLKKNYNPICLRKCAWNYLCKNKLSSLYLRSL